MEPSDPRLARWKGPGRDVLLWSGWRLYITYGDRLSDWELPIVVLADRDWPCKYFTITNVS